MGDTGLVSHPALGGFTVKKTFDYLTRDVKKEKKLIDDVINAFEVSIGGGRLIAELSGLDDKQNDKSKISDVVSSLVKRTENLFNSLINENVLSRVKVDSLSTAGKSIDSSEIDDKFKGVLLTVLWGWIIGLNLLKTKLNKIGFVDYSLGFRFDHSAKSVRVNDPKGNTIFTLNNDNSLEFSTDGGDSQNVSVKFNMTFLPPGKSKK